MGLAYLRAMADRIDSTAPTVAQQPCGQHPDAGEHVFGDFRDPQELSGIGEAQARYEAGDRADSAGLLGRLRSRTVEFYDLTVQGAETQPDEICHEAAAHIEALEAKLAAVTSELFQSRNFWSDELSAKNAQLAAAEKANEVLRTHIAETHNKTRHTLSAEIEAAMDKAFGAMSGISVLALARAQVQPNPRSGEQS